MFPTISPNVPLAISSPSLPFSSKPVNVFVECQETKASWCDPVLSRQWQGQHSHRECQRSHSSSELKTQRKLQARKTSQPTAVGAFQQTSKPARTTKPAHKKISKLANNHGGASSPLSVRSETQHETKFLLPSAVEETPSSHPSTLRSTSDKAKAYDQTSAKKTE